jgi:predicted amidophosphoribosyltransferase
VNESQEAVLYKGGQVGGLAHNINVKETKKCPNCNNDMDMAARFCPSCGSDTQKAVQTDTTVCSECGAQIPNKYKFSPSAARRGQRRRVCRAAAIIADLWLSRP